MVKQSVNVKDLVVRVIDAKLANDFIKKWHYSGKVVPNSQLHFGVLLNGVLHGVMQFGPPMLKHKMIKLVANTPWNGFIELNRLAFDPFLPKNSESRAISVALRIIKKKAPHIKWVVSFADGIQCGDGTIYRATGFLLTQIKKNVGNQKIDDEGNVHTRLSYTAHKPNEIDAFNKMKLADGYQFRYVYFLDETCKKNLQVEVLPYSKIKEMGASMYKGVKMR